MPYQIRVRRDTAVNWSDNNPILALGEIGYVTDQNRFKIGDGNLAWNSLPFTCDIASLDGFPLPAGNPANNNTLVFNSSTNQWTYAAGGAGGGSVTSVGLSMPNIFVVNNTPVITSGTLDVTFNTQVMKRFFAGPTSGVDATPTFRTIATTDLPDLSAAYQVTDTSLSSIVTATDQLGSGPNQLLYLSGSKTFSRTDFTATARTLLDDTSTSAMRTTLGLAISTDVQAYDAGLQSIAGLTTAADNMLYTTALDTYAVTTLTAFGRSLIDDADATAARTTLGFDTVDSLATSPQSKATIQQVKAGVVLAKGEVVYVSGATGDNLNVLKAQADTEATSSKTIGIMMQAAANVGDLAYVMTEGLLTGINTGSEVAGTPVWLSPSTAGGWTTTKPSSPDHLVFLGWIVKVNASSGSIYVKVANGQELDELHDVAITNVANNHVLQYDTSTTPATWKNKTLANAGIAASSHTHGNITNAGAINSTAGLIVKTGASGVLETLADSGTAGYVLSSNGAGTLSWVAQTGGGGTPNGSDTQVQFNDGGSTFGGDAGFTYVKGTDALTVVGSVTTGEVVVTNQGLVKLNEGTGGGTNYVGLKAPSTLANNNEYTFPNAVGAEGQALTIDTVSTNNATLKWTTPNDVYAVFTALNNIAPASNMATLSTLNDLLVLDFDTGTAESAVFTGVLPNNADLTNGLSVIVHWTANNTTSASTVEWKWEIASLASGNVTSRSYDTATVESKTYGTTTAYTVVTTTRTIANADTDGLAAGNAYAIKLTRNVTGTDDMGVDAKFIAMEVRKA